MDRNGNYILISYVNNIGPRISSIEDTLERYIHFYYASNGDLVTITAPGLTGGSDRQVMRFYYKSTDIDLGSSALASLFGFGVIPMVPDSQSAHVLEYVYMPSSSHGSTPYNTGYKFEYSPYGMIRQATEFRGMTVSSNSETTAGSVSSDGTMAAQTNYNYPTSAIGLTDVPSYSTRTDEWAGRTSGGSAPSTTFANSTASGEKISTITAPDGTITETHVVDSSGSWNDGLVKQTLVKYGSTTLSNTQIEWEQTPSSGPPRVAYLRVTDDGSTPRTKATVYSYTSYNNISSVSERDFTTDGSVSSTVLRHTDTTYVTSSNYTDRRLLHLPASVQVFAGGASTPTARVDYAYDDYGTSHANLTARDDIIMHSPAFDPFQEGWDVCDWECLYYAYINDLYQCAEWEWVCHWTTAYNSATDYRGNVTSVTKYADAATPSGGITHSITYDIAGNVMTAQMDCCQQKAFTYSGAGSGQPHDYAYPISVTSGNPSGTYLTTGATFDYNTGLPATTTDANSQVTTNSYNSTSLRLTDVDSPGGGETLLEYSDAIDSGGHFNVKTRVKLDSSGGGRYVDGYRYFDGRGAVTRTMGNNTSANGYSTQDIQYNEMGRAYRASNPYYASYSSSGSYSINPDGYWTTSSFDHLGRVTSVTMPAGDNSTSATTTVQRSYDGIYTTITDQAGKVGRQKRDALGRPIRLDEPTTSGLGTTGSPNQSTSYDYDVLGNLVHITQGSQDRYFKYDSLSRLIRERQVEQVTHSSHDLSDSLTGNSTWTRRIAYNSSGLVTSAYDARNVQTSFSYDDLNRVTQISYSDSTPTAHYYYDSQSLPSGAPSTSSPDSYSRGYSAGRLVAMTYGSGATGTYLGYDQMGRVNMQFQLTGSTPTKYKLSYAYNYAGLLTSETYPSSRTVSYGYDEGGRLSSVGDGSITFANSFNYAAHGGLSSETLGNSATHARSYNRALQPSQAKVTVNGTVLQQFDYGYGEFNTSTGAVDTSKNNGQIGKIDGTISGTAQWNQGFSYDELGRLSSVVEHQGSSMTTTTYSQAYTYDRYGNRFQSANSTLGLPAISSFDDIKVGLNNEKLRAACFSEY